MSYTLVVRQKTALFRTRLDLAALHKHFGAAYHIGSVGDYFTYSDAPPVPGPGGDTVYMIYGGARNGQNQLGRGFCMTCDKNDTCKITTLLPTTSHDLEDMFAFAGMLAELLGVKALEADGRAVPRAGLTALFADVRTQNAEVLRSFVATQKVPALSAVRMPFFLSEALCGRIAAVPPPNGVLYLSTYLAEKQGMEYTWLKPVFSQNSQGENLGTYTLAAETPSVIPLEPYLPAGGTPPFGGAAVTRWQVALVLKGAPLGTIPYGELTAFLEENELLKPFDEKNRFIRGLSLKRMRDLANGTAS